MTELTGGSSPLKEICQHLASLSQPVTSLQEGYTQLEGRVQVLTTPAEASVASSTTPVPATSTGVSVSSPVMMLPREPRQSIQNAKKYGITSITLAYLYLYTYNKSIEIQNLYFNTFFAVLVPAMPALYVF